MYALGQQSNVLHFSEFATRGSRRGTSGPGERPVVCREKLFVQVILCGSRPDLVGRTWSCRTLETDAGHLVFQCAHALPEDALVDVWIDLASEPGKYFLSGRVRRCEADDRGEHRVDVELEDGAATDIEAWRDLMG
jgi:hypothetical protein